MAEIKCGQAVWCRTATGEWWETIAAGPKTSSDSRPAWLAVPVRGWDPDDPNRIVNWPAEAVSTVDPGSGVRATPSTVAAPCSDEWQPAHDAGSRPYHCRTCNEAFHAGRTITAPNPAGGDS